jgi:hypothetical protein
MKWLQEHRRDLIPMIEPAITGKGDPRANDAFCLLLSIGFEAGRAFQKENPTASMMPDAYIPDSEQQPAT